MTITVDIDWQQPNESDLGRKRPEWYKFGGHDMVASVSDDNGNTVIVAADGEMRYNVYKLYDGDIRDVGVIRYCDQFEEWGIRADSDLENLPEPDLDSLLVSSSWSGYNTLYGPTGSGFYLEEINSPWFDLYLYTDGSEEPLHLDYVCFDVNEAVNAATEYLANGREEPPVHRYNDVTMESPSEREGETQ